MLSKKWTWLLTLVVISTLVLVACQPKTVVVEKKVVETKVVEVQKEVTKIVAGTPVVTTIVETKIVEKEKVVTATPAPVQKAKVLRINIATYPDILDPQKSSFVNEIAHLKLIYEGLTKLNEKLETVPGAAEKWEYNKDATELTFTLRKGLKYSDGSLLNAKRYEYSIIRNINPETAGEYAAITDEILGAPEWRTGATIAGEDACKTKDAEGKIVCSDEEKAEQEKTLRASVQALDASGAPCKDYAQADCLTLKIKLSKPAPYFHVIMGLWVAYPAQEELITTGGENWWTGSKYHIGNGPYVLKSLEPFVRGYFLPNKNYWGGVGKVDIEYSYITDSAVSFQAYKNNEFDIVGLAAEDLATVKADAVLSKEAMIYPGSCTMAVMFHLQKEPFTDPKVRQAFALALDRDLYVKDVLKGLGSPTLTWIPKGYPGYQEGEKRWGFDAAAAKQAIADSTYKSVDKLPKITATFGDTPRNRVRWEWLVAKWQDALGVKIEMNPVEPTTFTALTKDVKTSPQMYILGWCADYPDPQNWLSVYWKTGGFGERIAYSNPAFDKLVNEADSTVDPAKRADLYKQAQDLMINDVPAAFAYNTVNTYMIKPWVMGIKTTPQDAAWPGDVDPIGIDIDTTKLP